MTHDERWHSTCQAYLRFVATNGRRPSKHNPDERDLHNWYKHNRKRLNQGLLLNSRLSSFYSLLDIADAVRRRNQYS